MSLIQIIVLALLQGFTEFLPISSSAHLILVPVVGHWQDQGLDFDVAVHVGTLSAVVWYFRKELAVMLTDFFASLVKRQLVGESKLTWAVLWGTVPVGLAGLLLHDYVDGPLRSPLVIAVATIVFGLLLWWSDIKGRRLRDEHSINWKDVLVIGVAQAIALIPGTSRSGITMTAGLFMGLTRQAAARFSFLLSIPTIVLAGGYNGLHLLKQGHPIDWMALLLGIVLSGVTAYLVIHYFLKLLDRMGMLPFLIYRLVLGAVLLAVFW